MLSIQQLIKALRKLQSGSSNTAAVDLAKYLKNASSSTSTSTATTKATPSAASTTAMQAIMTSLLSQQESQSSTKMGAVQTPKQQTQQEHEIGTTNESSQNISQSAHSGTLSQILNTNGNGATPSSCDSTPTKSKFSSKSRPQQQPQQTNHQQDLAFGRSQQIQNFYQQQLLYIHTQQSSNLQAKQQQTQFSMSSLAAVIEPVAHKQQDETASSASGSSESNVNANGKSCHDNKATQGAAPSGKACFNTGFAEILQFMELIGNLKHTKRTGWVLRDVNDCESISGHMYRMSMMTFLLDGSEGLNQIRCMELALVHDLAESLVGDITPFCGVSKSDKRAMEFKAMDDICKLIEPRGKRIMELFEEYEHGQSAESKFVKDLDRLDMVMQAFEYEKRDNCLLKHQEFFDSTEGKFNHPFVKNLVDEICSQRRDLAKLKGATPPPSIHVPDMEDEADVQAAARNGHSVPHKTTQQTTSNSS